MALYSKTVLGFNDTNFLSQDIEDYAIHEFGATQFHPNDDAKQNLIGSVIWFADQSLISYKLDEWFKK